MDNRHYQRDFLSFGLLVSLMGHVFAFFLFVPILKNSFFLPLESQSIFLGSIYKKSDLAAVFPSGQKNRLKTFSASADFSKSAHLEKSPAAVLKPQASWSRRILFARGDHASPAVASPVFPETNISFGFSNFSEFIGHADFADLKKTASREDLSSIIVFKVLLSETGQVKAIKRIVGSGDPVFDTEVVLKLKNAVFRHFSSPKPAWVDVHFEIKN